MDIRINENISRISSMKTGVWAKPSADPDPTPSSGQDEIQISPEGRQTLGGEELSPLEEALQSTTREDIMGWMSEWKSQHTLTANWDAAVDPDGSLYAKAYMDSLAQQHDQARQTVEAYYAEEHQENLRFSNPHNHLVEKYKFSGSPYFRKDMSEAQRKMAFRQEEALLWGGRVALNDPWAMAASGGVLQGEDVEGTARAYARNVLDGLIQDYKALHGIE